MEKAIKQGFIYVMSNPSMPNLYKVGRTNNLETRRCDLSSPSGIPTPFKIIYSARVEDAENAEKAVHDSLKDYRVRKNREFFKDCSKIALIKRVRSSVPEFSEEEIDRKIQKRVLDL